MTEKPAPPLETPPNGAAEAAVEGFVAGARADDPARILVTATWRDEAGVTAAHTPDPVVPGRARQDLPTTGDGPDATDVFCPGRGHHPFVLFENPWLYVIPDRYPLTPGHLLIVSRPHLACWADATPAVLAELDRATRRLGRFLRDEYGLQALAWENGAVGQTVHHAHLHVIPVPLERLPPRGPASRAIPVPGWEWVRRHRRRQGGYHYQALGEERRLLPAGSRDVYEANRMLGRVLRLRHHGWDWKRTTSAADVAEVGRRWQRWVALEAAGHGVG